MGDIYQLAALIAAGMAGAIGHEVAHWLVWKVTGRRPVLDLWEMQVRPRAGPSQTTVGDRVAATAPYAVGLTAVIAGVLNFGLFAVAFGLAMIQIPSRVDVATMAGQTEWKLEKSRVH